ncbi:MAG: ATP-binding protein [Bacteroidia bacterium]
MHDSLFAAKAADEFSFIKTGEFDHLIYKPNSESLVVLSKPLEGVLFVLTPFSYLILFFSLLAVIPFGIARLMKERNPVQLSFKRRIQLSIVLLLFTSLILIGGGTIIYIISNSNQKNLSNISEKIHSLLIETEYILGKEPSLNPATAGDVAYSLTRQANVFFSDINLYSPNGYLYASSRPKIFEEGLVSKIMHPEAYFNLVVRQSSEFIHQESIGTLEYASAYVPLRNNENRVIGYLNLPYFAHQDELRQEIATFVVAIVNIYVLLIVLVVITAIFLSNTITAPLQLIRERLGQIRLGRKNEMIEWSGNDEIADLIAEYNRMVNELADSADKLARSERETAWREMAKQVAHEIKNPLTPMKLSTQMLRRAWDDKAEGFDERLDRFTRNLIEQIDTLSHIATEFSNFAKMPKMHLEKVDMLALLQNVTDFHQGENGATIELQALPAARYNVMTDKEQMLRVFNNLLRNAMQAIPDNREGEIRIEMKTRGNECLIEVHDNGSGIPEELRDKIFSPNFTTKNAGMGLGLALVKNIIESSGGKVWFESEPGTGTVFYISLPLAADV